MAAVGPAADADLAALSDRIARRIENFLHPWAGLGSTIPVMLQATESAAAMRIRRTDSALLHTLGGCLLLVPGTWAQTAPPRWEIVDTTASSDANGDTYSIDTSNSRTSTDGVEVTILIRLRDPRPLTGTEEEIRSVIRTGYIDCARHRFALTAITPYSDPDGLGNPLQFIDLARHPLQWQDIEPGSSNDSIRKAVCTRSHKTQPTQSPP
jgi:hypothetical protein